MKRPVMTFVVVAALSASGSFVASPVLAQTPAAATRVDNDTLEEAIENKWEADTALKNADLDVEVVNGVATISGKVTTASLKSRAAKLAHVTGVTRVENQITVDPNAPQGVAEKTKRGAETAANKTAEGVGTAAGETKKAVGKAADETKKGASKTGEVVSDTWITTKVKSKFVGVDALKHSDITVHTNNGVVTLTGTVATEAGRERAMEIAKNTDGVKSVVDKLTISPGKTE
jgi:osmotically-inducible protein OsmY